MRPRARGRRVLWLLVLAAVSVAIWYERLTPGQKRFVQNVVRQVPDLPARYAV